MHRRLLDFVQALSWRRRSFPSEAHLLSKHTLRCIAFGAFHRTAPRAGRCHGGSMSISTGRDYMSSPFRLPHFFVSLLVIACWNVTCAWVWITRDVVDFQRGGLTISRDRYALGYKLHPTCEHVDQIMGCGSRPTYGEVTPTTQLAQRFDESSDARHFRYDPGIYSI